MRDDLVRSLQEAGLDAVVKVALSPAWTSDWISEHGRAALAEAGISPPGPTRSGPVLLSLAPTRRELTCPRCGSAEVSLTSEFGSTACKAMYRCEACLEPFDHVKEI
jgi:ring-1,2-phenylacetyl-CoA epoxidase subunit PaaD